jgi:hypothetical protein
MISPSLTVTPSLNLSESFVIYNLSPNLSNQMCRQIISRQKGPTKSPIFLLFLQLPQLLPPPVSLPLLHTTRRALNTANGDSGPFDAHKLPSFLVRSTRLCRLLRLPTHSSVPDPPPFRARISCFLPVPGPPPFLDTSWPARARRCSPGVESEVSTRSRRVRGIRRTGH